MKMVGTQNANNLISSSTDGLVCSWLADMLAQPQVSIFKSDINAEINLNLGGSTTYSAIQQ